MEGNVVKAAWVLGGSILTSVVLAGVGLFVGLIYFTHGLYEQTEILSKRSAEAIMDAPKNTRVALDQSTPVKLSVDPGAPIRLGFDPMAPIKVGFDLKLPMALRVENSLDDATGQRARFEVEAKPTLTK